MKRVLILLFFFRSLAFCQAAEDNTATGKFYWNLKSLHLLPGNYFDPRVNLWPKEDWLEAPPRNPNYSSEAISFGDHRQNDYDPRANTLLSEEAARVQLAVLRSHVRPLTHGNFGEKLAHVFTEGVANVGEYNLASAYYQQVGLPTRPQDPMSVVNYAREHDVLRAIYSPILSSLKRSVRAQLQFELGERFFKGSSWIDRMVRKVNKTR